MFFILLKTSLVLYLALARTHQCSVLGPSLQQRHGGAGASPERGSPAGEGSGAQALQGAAQGAGDV